VPNAKGAFGQVFEGQTVGGEGVRLAIKKVPRPCLADSCVVVPCPGLTPHPRVVQITISGAIQSLLCIYPNLPNPRAHLAREWRASLLAVDHPNLCRSHAVEFTNAAGAAADLATCKYAFLVMEWAGDALIDVVLQRGGLDEATAREYFWQILVGIMALHGDGYSHRDIKPENITVRARLPPLLSRSRVFPCAALLGMTHCCCDCLPTCAQLLDPSPEFPQGLIKIVDFGLAKSESQGPLESNVGTERYKAPEIAPGASYDSKVDVWSLGCTLYEMLTAKGSLANRANGVARMAQAAYKKGDMPLARALISRCLTENPSARPSVRDLLEDPFFQGREIPPEPQDVREQKRLLRFSFKFLLCVVFVPSLSWQIIV
jgi:serine/threonine protein kinase